MTTDTRVEHTPGPWHAGNEDGPGLWWSVYAEDEHGQIDIANAVYGFHGQPDLDGAYANARLIASAPDLLAALKALTQLGTDENGAIIIGPRGWEMAQAAIKQARGE